MRTVRSRRRLSVLKIRITSIITALPAALHGGRAGADEGIEHKITNIGVHVDQPLWQSDWKRRRMADTARPFRRDLPHIDGCLHELVTTHRADRRKPDLGAILRTDRAVESTLGGDDHALAEVADHWVARTLKAPPRTISRCAALLDPQHFATKEQSKIVLQNCRDVGRQRAVWTPAEVGHVDRDAPARLEHADAFSEHVAKLFEVFDVRRRDMTVTKRLFVLFACEVRRRRDNESDAVVCDIAHLPGIADDEPIDAFRGSDVIIRADLWSLKSFVERP